MTEKLNKELIYDDQISPLMMQIIEIAQKHGIAMIANFAIPTEDDEDLVVTTCTVDESGDNPPHHTAALRALNAPGFSAASFAITMTTSTNEPR